MLWLLFGVFSLITDAQGIMWSPLYMNFLQMKVTQLSLYWICLNYHIYI